MPPAMDDTTADLIAGAMALAGTDGFVAPFMGLVTALGAGQVMVFRYGANTARCALSRNQIEGAVAGQLAGAYLDGGFRDDPLVARIRTLPDTTREVWTLAALQDRMSPAYRAQFFTAPGLADKRAVLIVAGGLRVCVNLYWAGACTVDDGAVRVVAELARLHVAATGDAAYPALMGLSDRERWVCLGILRGLKSEQIAHDLGIGVTSVATYRKRAYAKLGINAKGALFAICRG